MDYNQLPDKETVKLDIQEIEAYRALDGRDFDFGTGLIRNELEYGSEDADFQCDIWYLHNLLNLIDYKCEKRQNKSKVQPHKRYYKEREKVKLNRLQSIHWMNVRSIDGRLARRYRGKASMYLKKRSNKKIRQYTGDIPTKGNHAHKIFDFWWELY